MQQSDALTRAPGVQLRQEARSESAGSEWRTLFLLGGIAALLTVVLGLTEVAIESSQSALSGGPVAAADWFALLQTNRLLGLALLEIFEVALLPLGGLMFLALYAALRRTDQSLMLVAIFLELLSISIFLAGNPALAMLGLGDQYAAATSEAQKGALLATAQVLLSAWQGTGHFLTFFLGSLAGLIVSVVMLRSKTFGRVTAIVGIAANLLGLPGPALGFILWTINGLLVLLWTILVGIRLLQLARVSSLTAVE